MDLCCTGSGEFHLLYSSCPYVGFYPECCLALIFVIFVFGNLHLAVQYHIALCPSAFLILHTVCAHF